MIPTTNNGTIFYRLYQFAKGMKERGVEVVLPYYNLDLPFDQGPPWQDEILKDPTVKKGIELLCGGADIVIWQGVRRPKALDLFLEMRSKFCKPFLTESDDYVLSLPKGHISAYAYHPGSSYSSIILIQIKNSDGLIVSTPYLKEMYSKFNHTIDIVENCIDFSVWGDFFPRPHRDIRIGWVGGGSHAEDLRLIKDVIFKLLDKYNNVKFVCLHGIPDFFKKHPKIECDPSFKDILEYPQWVKDASFDIGVAPLQDNHFNRAKSNLRWLEYSAMGIPTVASNISHFRETIKHEKTGFLAETQEEWAAFLTALIENEGLRKSMGKKALKSAKRDFNIKKNSKKYLKVLEGKL